MIKRLDKKGYIGKNEYYKIENQQIQLHDVDDYQKSERESILTK